MEQEKAEETGEKEVKGVKEVKEVKRANEILKKLKEINEEITRLTEAEGIKKAEQKGEKIEDEIERIKAEEEYLKELKEKLLEMISSLFFRKKRKVFTEGEIKEKLLHSTYYSYPVINKEGIGYVDVTYYKSFSGARTEPIKDLKTLKQAIKIIKENTDKEEEKEKAEEVDKIINKPELKEIKGKKTIEVKNDDDLISLAYLIKTRRAYNLCEAEDIIEKIGEKEEAKIEIDLNKLHMVFLGKRYVPETILFFYFKDEIKKAIRSKKRVLEENKKVIKEMIQKIKENEILGAYLLLNKV